LVFSDLFLELGNFQILGGDFVGVVFDVLGLVSGELGEGLFEVLLDVVEELLDLVEGFSVGEFLTLHGQEGLDEGGFGSVTEGLLDLGHVLVELGDLSQTDFLSVPVEGQQEVEGILDGADGLGVFGGNLVVLLLGQVSLVGQFLDVVIVIVDPTVEGGDLLVQGILLDVEDGLEERVGVGNIDIGGINFALESSNVLLVLEGSLLVGILSILLGRSQIVDHIIDGGDQVLDGTLGHSLQLGNVHRLYYVHTTRKTMIYK